MENDLIQFLSQFVTEQRFEKIITNSALRTDYITIVLEDIFQPHNASAVLRTCDCFGIQNVHIIENRNKYKLNPDIELGAAQWLSLNKYSDKNENTFETINFLKSKGYRIIATTPHTNDIELDNFDISKGKFALLFGTELEGLSDIAINNADEFLKIPMYGFTESFNISVSAAITIHHLNHKLRASDIHWQLDENKMTSLRLNWLKKSVKNSDAIINEYLKRLKNN